MTKSDRRVSITDSPWYWAYVFCAAGLVALLIIGPKFQSRQAQIEKNLELRQRAAATAAGDPPLSPIDNDSANAIRLWPLFVCLGGLLIVAIAQLAYARRRHGAAAEKEIP